MPPAGPLPQARVQFRMRKDVYDVLDKYAATPEAAALPETEKWFLDSLLAVCGPTTRVRRAGKAVAIDSGHFAAQTPRFIFTEWFLYIYLFILFCLFEMDLSGGGFTHVIRFPRSPPPPFSMSHECIPKQ